ncbi:MAG: hypothetical protein QM756_29525 [Polyangiaceae bacterium]
MKTLVDARFQREAHDFALRFNCEHCAHYDDTDASCSNGFPNASHREAELVRGLVQELEFCKQFELV